MSHGSLHLRADLHEAATRQIYRCRHSRCSWLLVYYTALHCDRASSDELEAHRALQSLRLGVSGVRPHPQAVKTARLCSHGQGVRLATAVLWALIPCTVPFHMVFEHVGQRATLAKGRPGKILDQAHNSGGLP